MRQTQPPNETGIPSGKQLPGRRVSSIVDLVRHPGHKNGFTLVELVTVIAIIAILIALLFPVLSSVRDRGNTSRCLFNLRQWGTALTAYLAEHDGVFPEEGVVGTDQLININNTNAWFNVLASYIGELSLAQRAALWKPQPRPGDGSIYTCPAVTESDLREYESSIGRQLDPYTDPFMSYGYNLWIDHADRAGEHGGQTAYGRILRISQIREASRFVVFAEVAGAVANCHAYHLDYRHNKNTAVNLCFADGHAATYLKADIYVDKSEFPGNEYKRKNRGGIIWDPEGDNIE